MLLPDDDDDVAPSPLAILEGGVDAFNAWRTAHPDERPDLTGVDFTDPSFAATPLWDARNARVSLVRVNFSGAKLTDAVLSGTDLQHADLSGALLDGVHLDNADLRRANLSGADLPGADLRGADLLAADVTNANLAGARIEGANLRRTNLTDTDVTGVEFTVDGLKGKCRGIRAEACHGNATFRREVMDQDYLDQVEVQVMAAYRHKGGLWPALADGFMRPLPLIAGLLISLPAGLQLSPGFLPMMGDVLAGDMSSLRIGPFLVLVAIVAAAVTFACVMGSTFGRVLAYRIWGLFSFGRRWDVVVFFSGGMILFYALLYTWLSPTHVVLDPGGTESIAFFPLFVSMMGFCTLGVTGLAEPVTDLGALVMMLNVLSGFVTLGLLLSVLGNVFARRS